MTHEQRYKASVDLTLTYFRSYYHEWRLTKILTNQKLLDNRYDFFKDISEQTKQWDDETGDSTIAQEIKHGLYFDSIAECIQYIEDLFALIRAAKKPDYFVKNIVTYKAGEVTSKIKVFKADKKSISKAFHFPTDLPFEKQSDREDFENGINNLIEWVNDLTLFYKNYEFFYNQYKHGLAVAMRPLGNLLSEEQIEKDKKGLSNPYLTVYDNLNLKAASKKGTFKLQHGTIMPGFTQNVMPFISELEKTNNFLRFVFPPDFPDFSFDILVNIAHKTKTCLNTFIGNYSLRIKSKDDKVVFHIPQSYREKKYIEYTYSKD